MYAKVFRSIYDGTLADDWRALVTFQQLLILCDAQGVVDMTHSAIASTTRIPIEIIREGIFALEMPDPQSRSAEDQGRRIRRLDVHRDWGWVITNHKKYRALQTREDKNLADRERIRASRAASKGEAKAPPAPKSAGKTCPTIKLATLFDEILPELRSPVVWTEARKAPVKARWAEMAAFLKWETEAAGLEWFAQTFRAIRESKFLMGKSNPRPGSMPFKLTFDWLFKPANFAKVTEGAYHEH